MLPAVGFWKATEPKVSATASNTAQNSTEKHNHTISKVATPHS